MSNQRIIVDPITRIEGHLRIEVEVDEKNWSYSEEKRIRTV